MSLRDNSISYETFLIHHYNCTMLPLASALPQSADITTCAEKDPSICLDTSEWAKATQIDHKDQIPMSVTIMDMIKCLISISYVGCCHLLQHCIKRDSTGKL